MAVCLGLIGGDEDAGPGRDLRVRQQPAEGGDRLVVLILQVQRVVIEARLGQQGGGTRRQDEQAADDLAGVGGGQADQDRRDPGRRAGAGGPDGAAPPRPEGEHAQQGGQDRQGHRQADEHPDAGDQAQFRHAGVGGGDESEETGGGAGGA